MEGTTLTGTPRKIMNWAGLVMMLLAAAVAIGNVIFG
jgi:hypothetical protein